MKKETIKKPVFALIFEMAAAGGVSAAEAAELEVRSAKPAGSIVRPMKLLRALDRAASGAGRSRDKREIGIEAVWSLSTAKPGNGVEQLRDNNVRAPVRCAHAPARSRCVVHHSRSPHAHARYLHRHLSAHSLCCAGRSRRTGRATGRSRT